MDLLITVSNKDSANILAPLLCACKRRACEWEVFLTHDGVQTLHSQNIVELLEQAECPAIVCHDSWNQYSDDTECPVTLGSQTNHSEMMARATRVISL